MEAERKKRILIVHRSEGVAVAEADALSGLGYEVEMCSGPAYAACPVLRGERCDAVEGADVLIYDVWATKESDSGRRLIEGLRDLYPEIPIVVTAPGMLLDWVETEGPHGVTPLVGVPTAERLDAAVREALDGVRQSTGVGPER